MKRTLYIQCLIGFKILALALIGGISVLKAAIVQEWDYTAAPSGETMDTVNSNNGLGWTNLSSNLDPTKNSVTTDGSNMVWKTDVPWNGFSPRYATDIADISSGKQWIVMENLSFDWSTESTNQKIYLGHSRKDPINDGDSYGTTVFSANRLGFLSIKPNGTDVTIQGLGDSGFGGTNIEKTTFFNGLDSGASTFDIFLETDYTHDVYSIYIRQDSGSAYYVGTGNMSGNNADTLILGDVILGDGSNNSRVSWDKITLYDSDVLHSTWDGGSGSDSNTTTGQNWVGDSAPVSGDTLKIRFDGSTRTSPNLDSTLTLNSVEFAEDAAAFTLSTSNSSSLTMDGDFPSLVQNSDNNQSIQTNIQLNSTVKVDGVGSGDVTLSGVISGTGGIEKINHLPQN